MKNPIIETYVPQNKRLPYQVAAGIGVAFVIGLIYSPINTQYNYTSFVPIIQKDTVYVHKITSLTIQGKDEKKKSMKVPTDLAPTAGRCASYQANNLGKHWKVEAFATLQKLTGRSFAEYTLPIVTNQC